MGVVEGGCWEGVPTAASPPVLGESGAIALLTVLGDATSLPGDGAGVETGESVGRSDFAASRASSPSGPWSVLHFRGAARSCRNRSSLSQAAS